MIEHIKSLELGIDHYAHTEYFCQKIQLVK
jgi:hypothetical protein